MQSVAEAAQWLGYTYLYVRMLQNPDVYAVPPDQLDKDPVLLQFRVDLVRFVGGRRCVFLLPSYCDHKLLLPPLKFEICAQIFIHDGSSSMTVPSFNSSNGWAV